MGNFEYKEGQFTLFNNSYKERDNQPDMKGKGMINGEEMQIAGWWKEPRGGGEQYLSIQISEAYRPGQSGSNTGRRPAPPTPPTRRMQDSELPRRYTAPQVDDLADDDIPF